jgi:dienelactone hydrolase
MSFLNKLAVLSIALSAASVSAFAQTPVPSTKHIAARVELHPIATVTMSDTEFLTGAKVGKPVTTVGELRFAQGDPAVKQPAVILMHGSSGVGPNIEPWTALLNEMGIATFVIDAFTGRGLTTVGTNQAMLGRLNFIRDIYAGLDILAKHPRIDRERIVLMGFSRGGQAALYASLDRFHKLWNTSGAKFAAYVPFYPDCSTTYEGDTETSAPIRVFHGTPDDYNPVAPCKDYMARLKAAGRDITLTEYANAPHSFDNPIGSVMISKGSQTVRACKIAEKAGALINTATNAPFAYTDACVQVDPTVGGNPEALAAARKDVSAFLAETFKLAK